MFKHFRAIALVACMVSLTYSSSCADDASDAALGEGLGDAVHVQFAVQVVGLTVASAELQLESEDLHPVEQRATQLEPAQANIATTSESDLPPGSYTLTVTVQGDDPSARACSAWLPGVELLANLADQAVFLTLDCSPAGDRLLLTDWIDAHVEVAVEVKADGCPSLIEELTISPLDPIIGHPVRLHAVVPTGVMLQWSATGGSFADDAQSYLCPALEGSYELTGTFTGTACVQIVRQRIHCRARGTHAQDHIPGKFVSLSSQLTG